MSVLSWDDVRARDMLMAGRPMRYFRERTGAKDFYLVHMGAEDHVVDGILVLPFATFCREAGMV